MGRGRQPRVISERTGKWMLNLFPPLLFQRVRVVEIGAGFRSCRVRVGRSLLTRNLNGTTFGGAIFAGADPFYAVMYWQVFARLGEPVQTWLRGATIRYLKPARSALMLDFALSDQQVDEARAALTREGRFVRWHRTAALDRDGVLCAEVETEVYLRLPREDQQELSAF